MKKIPNTFRKNGYDYLLLKRCDRLAIYEQSDKGKTFAYEFHKIRLNQPSIIKYKQPNGDVNVVKRPLREALPSNEDWGRYGWTFNTLKEADIKYESLKGVINN